MPAIRVSAATLMQINLPVMICATQDDKLRISCQ